MENYHDLCFQLIISSHADGEFSLKRVLNGKLTDATPLSGVKAIVKNINGGYESEINIPLKNIIGTLSGKNIGFTIAVNDNDDGKYKHTLIWTGKKNYCDRSGFANVFFK